MSGLVLHNLGCIFQRLLFLFSAFGLPIASADNYAITVGGDCGDSAISSMKKSVVQFDKVLNERKWNHQLVFGSQSDLNGYHSKQLNSSTRANFFQSLERVKQLIKEGDQFLLNILAHGSTDNRFHSHSICLSNGESISLKDPELLKYLKDLNQKKAKVAVFDNSCFSGETVKYLEKFGCILSTQSGYVSSLDQKNTTNPYNNNLFDAVSQLSEDPRRNFTLKDVYFNFQENFSTGQNFETIDFVIMSTCSEDQGGISESDLLAVLAMEVYQPDLINKKIYKGEITHLLERLFHKKSSDKRNAIGMCNFGFKNKYSEVFQSTLTDLEEAQVKRDIEYQTQDLLWEVVDLKAERKRIKEAQVLRMQYLKECSQKSAEIIRNYYKKFVMSKFREKLTESEVDSGNFCKNGFKQKPTNVVFSLYEHCKKHEEYSASYFECADKISKIETELKEDQNLLKLLMEDKDILRSSSFIRQNDDEKMLQNFNKRKTEFFRVLRDLKLQSLRTRNPKMPACEGFTF